MDGVMPKPPAEFSALAMASWIFSDEMISCRCRATRTRPGEAKISPMKRMFMRSAKGAARTAERARNLRAPHSVLREFLEDGMEKEKERKLPAESASVLDPVTQQGGALRASLGFSNDSL